MKTIEMFDITGKISLVTGGYGLYGAHISRALAESGSTVFIASRNKTKCVDYAKELEKEGFLAEGASLDLGSEESINNLIGEIVRKYDRIDILVNNAVSREGMADLENATKEGWEKAQRINSTGLMLITKTVIKKMKQQKSGNIINISSIQGINGPNFTVYGSTGMSSPINYTYDKWGIIGFTKWIANYYGKYNIRANCISPGGYNPGLTDDENNEFTQNYKKLTPLGRFADDHDIKEPVVFLASEASKYITGHNLILDGGWSCW